MSSRRVCNGGHFTQTDPMPLGAGSAFESAYVYGNNNPLVYTDPSGLRGGLPGCPWSNNPIASQQPELLALRSQIWIPVPGTLPPRTVPPRTVPPRPMPPVTVRPRPTTTTTIDEPETTEVTTTTRPGQTCTNERLRELQIEKNRLCNRPRSCKDPGLSCADIKVRIQNGSDCVRIRTQIGNECFGGNPNPAHVQELANVRNVLSVCQKAWKDKKCGP